MQRKQKFLMVAILFSVLFLVVSPRIAHAQISPLLLNRYALQHMVYSQQFQTNASLINVIINRDTLLVYYAGLNGSSYPAKDGFAMVFPISSLYLTDFIMAYLNGTLPSLNGTYFTATLFPSFEFYNDTNNNSVCDITRTASTNETEAVYEVIPLDYLSVEITNLSRIAGFSIPTTKPSVYTWGIQYNNVTTGVYNATLVNSTGVMDGTFLGNDSFSYLRYDYNYTFDSPNNQWLLKRAVNISAYDNSGEENFHVNLSLAIVQLHLAGGLGAQVANITGVNSTNAAFLSNVSTQAPTVNFLLNTTNVGTFDINLTYPTYILDNTTEYNATAVVNPSLSVGLDVWFNNFTGDDNLNVQVSGIILSTRTCYNTWNGSQMYHDPLYILPLYSTQLPLYYSIIPDLFFIPPELTNLILIVLVVVLIGLVVVLLGDKGTKKAKDYLGKRTTTKKKLTKTETELKAARSQLRKERKLKKKYYNELKGKKKKGK